MTDATLSEQLRQVQEALAGIHTPVLLADNRNGEIEVHNTEEQAVALFVERVAGEKAALALMPSLIERVRALEAQNVKMRAALASLVRLTEDFSHDWFTSGPEFRVFLKAWTAADALLARHAVARENAVAGSTVGGVA